MGNRTCEGHGLPTEALSAYLERELGQRFPIHGVRRLTSGASNRMYVLGTDGGDVVLRIPPQVKTSRTAHDIGREYRMLCALEGTPVPHPRPIHLCTDSALLGRPFMVVEHVQGFHLELPLTSPYDIGPARMRELAEAFIDNLAIIASVDWRAAGLKGFGRPEGFLDRQVDRWLSQLAEYQGRPLPHLEEVTAWLRANQPSGSEPGILHGDYQFLNVLFAPQPPPLVVAIVDWEQSTIGDPLLDLGWVVGLWAEAGERSAVSGDEPWITQTEGMPSRVELIDRYAKVSGRDVSDIAYYAVLALFKLACILEGSYAKAMRGESDIVRHKEFGAMVVRLLEDAAAITRGERT